MKIARWPIERTWTVHCGQELRTGIRTAELTEFPVCCMLGSAGLGKTRELEWLATKERGEGQEVAGGRLATIAQTADALTQKLDALAIGATGDTAFYLDALDELMIPVRQTALIVPSWIRDTLSPIKPRVRLSCRSGVWPPAIKDGLLPPWRLGENTLKAVMSALDGKREFVAKVQEESMILRFTERENPRHTVHRARAKRLAWRHLAFMFKLVVFFLCCFCLISAEHRHY